MHVQVGQPVRITITDTDTTPGSSTIDTLQDPGTLELRIEPPTGDVQSHTIDNGDLVKDDDGTYHYDLTPTSDDAGKRLWYRAVATGAFAGASPPGFIDVDDPGAVG